MSQLSFEIPSQQGNWGRGRVPTFASPLICPETIFWEAGLTVQHHIVYAVITLAWQQKKT